MSDESRIYALFLQWWNSQIFKGTENTAVKNACYTSFLQAYHAGWQDAKKDK